MTGLLATVLSVLTTGAFGFLLVVLLVRYFVLPFRGDILPRLAGAPPTRRRAKSITPPRAVLKALLAAFLLSRLLLVLTVLIYQHFTGQLDDFLASPLRTLIRWDAEHYISLALNGYTNVGDARLHLVFFPLYPMLLRAVYRLTALHPAVTGIIVSNLCFLGAGYALYRLAELNTSSDDARRAMTLLCFMPLAIFYALPYSESLFLMLTVTAALCARRRRFGCAIALGMLASATRLLGLLIAVPIFYEYLLVLRERRFGAKDVAASVAKTSLIALGFVAYLLLNVGVSGHPLTFLTYQREHWSQTFGSLPNTVMYTVRNALTYGDIPLRLGTWIPQIVMIMAAVSLLFKHRRISPGDAAYQLLYLYFAVAPTWLLSGARYLSALYPAYILLSVAAPKRLKLPTLIACAAAQVYMTNYFLVGSVM